MNNEERVLNWDDEIQESGGNFILLPAGDYNFFVEKFERARHQGSANLPACPMALLTLKIDGGEHGQATVVHRLFLHSKTEGFLSNFFEAIGEKKEGERVKMNWQIVTGAKGRCTLEVNNYIDKKSGEERSNNQIKTFLSYDVFMKNQVGAPQQQQQYQQQPQYQAPQQQPQQTYQQPQQQQQQAPFPTGGAPQQGGYTPGQF